MLAFFVGSNYARDCRRLLADNRITIIVTHVSCLPALVVANVVTYGHEYLVIQERTILAVRFLISIPTPQHEHRRLNPNVRLEGVGVHIN